LRRRDPILSRLRQHAFLARQHARRNAAQFPDLLEWCVKAGASHKAEASRYRALAKNDQVLTAKIFEDAIAIREAIYRVVLAAATRRISGNSDLRLLTTV